MRTSTLCVLIAALGIAGCVRVPMGPNVTALPGSGKSFDAFEYDDAVCRDWAAWRIGKSPNRAADEHTITGAGVGTVLGAATGAAIGAAAGDPAMGAAVGAGTGLLGGTAVGAASGEEARQTLQYQYDSAYMQCMYARGNKVPVPRGSMDGYADADPGRRPHRAVPPPPAGRPPGRPPGGHRDGYY